jgi:hypothetical protein
MEVMGWSLCEGGCSARLVKQALVLVKILIFYWICKGLRHLICLFFRNSIVVRMMCRDNQYLNIFGDDYPVGEVKSAALPGGVA